MGDTVSEQVLGLIAQIVAAHIGHNQVAADALPAMIQSIYRSLASAGTSDTAPATVLIPAVAVKRSVFPDFIVCLEDGKKLKMLKRHLQTSFGMTPADYRAKWSLPLDYPMIAPNYASTRSSLAKKIGLGRKPTAKTIESEATQLSEPGITRLPSRRARGSKG